MPTTYSWRGPLSFQSMTAQIMLRYGLHYTAAEGDVQVAYEVEADTITLTAVCDEQVYRRRGLQNRTEAGQRLQDVLSEWTGIPLGEWGYLVGMRPGKVLHRVFASPHYEAEARALLQAERVAPHRRELLVQIGAIQRRYVPTAWRQIGKRTAIYIGIPFCPSHCTYCSFPARVASPTEDWAGFTAALCADVRAAAVLLKRYGLRVDSVYFGGGTPTVLPEKYFEELLATIAGELLPAEPVEYTVEAGRPDTMTAAKLDVMLAHGVNRVSVNPQTLQDEVLRGVQRAHTVRAVAEVYAAVRSRPFKAVNMDFIAGLPGQTAVDMQANMRQALAWRPENITVHTLAIKRHSPLAAAGAEDLPAAATTAGMVRTAGETLAGAGYLPYYLYRQKYMTADLANVGYTLPGYESIYNIQMMEERIHVIGIGPGATSRVIRNEAFQLQRLVFPWNPEVYREKQAAYMAKRAHLFEIIAEKGAKDND